MAKSSVATKPRDILGNSALRPDGAHKVQGSFEFTSDLHAENMLWGATLRSPHPYAKIMSIDTSAALALPGVHCVITADDVPGKSTYGLISSDQPVFASD
jgi:CO/xanthine dehydrogenase Mo-binding subunit